MEETSQNTPKFNHKNFPLSRKRPKVPNFNKIAANTIEPATGAST